MLPAIPIVLMVTLHDPGGHEIYINPHEVSSIRAPAETTEQHFGKGTRCVVIMTNGKANAVTEDCPSVRLLLENEK